MRIKINLKTVKRELEISQNSSAQLSFVEQVF